MRAPIKVPHRQVLLHQCKQKSLQLSNIRESSNPYASPIVRLRKKLDEKLNLCIVYWLLNAKTHNDVYPLPGLGEALDVLDLAHGFQQIPRDQVQEPMNANPC